MAQSAHDAFLQSVESGRADFVQSLVMMFAEFQGESAQILIEARRRSQATDRWNRERGPTICDQRLCASAATELYVPLRR